MLRISYILFFFSAILLFPACQDQSVSSSNAAEPATESSAFDPDLATALGADEYGMKQYVMAFLKAGPNRDRSPEEAQALQRAHLNNINRMAEAGQLVLAGPFMDDGEVRGIYIFNVQTIEEAKALTETDPAIQAGSLEMDLHPWYGSAGLMQLNALHSKLAKKGI